MRLPGRSYVSCWNGKALISMVILVSTFYLFHRFLGRYFILTPFHRNNMRVASREAIKLQFGAVSLISLVFGFEMQDEFCALKMVNALCKIPISVFIFVKMYNFKTLQQ